MAAWGCIFLLPFVFSPRFREPNFDLTNPWLAMFTTLNIFLLAFYYFNSLVLIPKLLANKKWLLYSLAVIGCFVAYTLLPRLFEEAIRAEMPERVAKRMARRKPSYNPFNGSSALFFLVFTISTSIKVIQRWFQAEQIQKETENEKLNTELSFLKTQMNPHFLFNTLNNIYSMALVKSDETAGAVMKLSSIMRYVLNETKNDKVALEKEINFIEDYITLQRVRLTDKVHIQFDVEGNIEGARIAHLLLIPFVENAFKYGVSTKEASDIIIRITVDEKEIHFYISNSIVAAQSSINGSTGIGLKNTKRRLDLMYPEHLLKVSKEDKKFIVELSLHK